MNKKILYFIGIVFVFILGCLWHFFYPWSRQNFLVGLVAPVNESVPEHLKLLFFPFLIFSVFEYIKRGKKIKNFIFSKTPFRNGRHRHCLLCIYRHFGNQSFAA